MVCYKEQDWTPVAWSGDDGVGISLYYKRGCCSEGLYMMEVKHIHQVKKDLWRKHREENNPGEKRWRFLAKPRLKQEGKTRRHLLIIEGISIKPFDVH